MKNKNCMSRLVYRFVTSEKKSIKEKTESFSKMCRRRGRCTALHSTYGCVLLLTVYSGSLSGKISGKISLFTLLLSFVFFPCYLKCRCLYIDRWVQIVCALIFDN